jgi:hypothetical protein
LTGGAAAAEDEEERRFTLSPRFARRMLLALAGALLAAGCSGAASPGDGGAASDLGGARPDGGCANDTDCRTGMRCNPTTGTCVACLVDDDCPPEQVCAGGACAEKCSDLHACAGGLACCSGGCVDTTSDALNCGACGTACPAAPHAIAGCTAGTCGVGGCEDGWGDCNGNPQDGCETSLSADVDHCGACTTTCSADHAGTPSCAAGHCLLTCDTGWSDCNHDPNDGCEAQLDTDPLNCGACGTICPGSGFATSEALCTGGACSFVCVGENYDVDGMTSNGCERADDPGHHTTADPTDLGSSGCSDSSSQNTVSGKMPSDSRMHDPAIEAFDASVGAAPDFYSEMGTGGTFCQNDYALTFTTSGGAAGTTCYQATITTDKMSSTIMLDGNSSQSVSSGSGSYSSDTAIVFTVEKICSLPVQEYVTYTLSYHL